MRGFCHALLACLLCCAVAQAAPTTGRPRTHLVRRTDTLSGIAVRYGITQQQLRQWNGIQGDRVLAGQRLRLTPPPPRRDWHVVRKGETLAQVARRYRLQPDQLRQLNGLRTARLVPGQRLRVPARIEPSPALKTVAHPVQVGETLAQVAQRHGTSVAVLRELNEVTGDSIRPGSTLRVPGNQATTETPPPEQYRVRNGDSLGSIAARYQLSTALIRQLNRLESDVIRPGQALRLRPGKRDEGVHVVQPGETLTGLARRFAVSVETLRDLNGLEGDRILAGQKLRLEEAAVATHRVERGDALWEIAQAYGVPLADLRQLNGLSSDRIYAGQVLKVSGSGTPGYVDYTVKKGDNLTQLARLHQMSVAELKRASGLRSATLHPGQRLRVRPLLGGPDTTAAAVAADRLPAALPQLPLLASDNGPYYFSQPAAARQTSKGYFEGQPRSPRAAYRQARRLFDAFAAAVDSLEPLSDDLAGWHIVLDPGHGGLDPGAIVASPDDDGTPLFVVEDEYMYDVALRVYVLLRLHGASVWLTVLSPDHLIRNAEPPSQTFVNEKNEVYNSATANQPDNVRAWPRGANLNQRVRLARQALARAPVGRRLFLSFHGDIDPNSPEAPLVLYYQSRDGRRGDPASRAFARAMLPALGADAYCRGQALGVLRDNPADYKVLLELRNMAYRDHLWALRYDQLRHRDAEKVVRGIRDWVGSQGLSMDR